MLKKALGIALACVFLFPLSALASEQIPAEVEQAIRQDLNRFKNSLVAHGGFHLNSENAKEVMLGEGMKRYIVKGDSLPNGPIQQADEILEFTGYIFPISSNGESNGIVRTDLEGTEIIGGSDDFTLASELAKAEQLIGINENSKLIYDNRLTLVSLVSRIEGKDVVVLLRESGALPDLKPFVVYNIHEFKEMLDAYQAEVDASNADADPSEPRSGGSLAYSSSSTPRGTNTGTIAVLSSAGVGIVAGTLLMIRRKKGRSGGQ
ncbi:hypothetical protein [Paenibacillus massiliensis]|uniref:hypothetical protein n=1 Tax=Paenibacillus massiliensis TaxID=225917 RepID=UPI00035C7194|nr:hypothetical protein [Paenibacillus massiliensis]